MTSIAVYCPNPSNLSQLSIDEVDRFPEFADDLLYDPSTENSSIVGKYVNSCNDCFGNGQVDDLGYVDTLKW